MITRAPPGWCKSFHVASPPEERCEVASSLGMYLNLRKMPGKHWLFFLIEITDLTQTLSHLLHSSSWNYARIQQDNPLVTGRGWAIRLTWKALLSRLIALNYSASVDCVSSASIALFAYVNEGSANILSRREFLETTGSSPQRSRLIFQTVATIHILTVNDSVFLVTYFESVGRQTNTVTLARRWVSLTIHHGKRSFEIVPFKSSWGAGPWSGKVATPGDVGPVVLSCSGGCPGHHGAFNFYPGLFLLDVGGTFHPEF